MTASQNGWPVRTTSTGLVPLPWITGRVLPGDVFDIFDHLCTRFDAEVEPIVVGASWGWANRPVRGSTSTSNHASATALDLNSPAHPLGKRGTFTKQQVDAIHAILADLDGVVRWGGDYENRADEMHFEINATPDAVARVARRIREGDTDMTPEQATKLDQAARDAARAVARGQVNTRLILRVAESLGVKIDDVKALLEDEG